MQQKAMAFGCCMSFGGTSGRRRGAGHAAGPATAPPERRTCTTGRGTPTLPDGSKRPPRCSVAILCDSSAAATHRRHRWSCGVHHTEPGGGRNSRLSGRVQGLPTSIGAGAPGGRLRTICRPVSEISASRRNCACSRLTVGLLPAPGAARDARQVDRQDGDRSASSPAQAETVSRRTYEGEAKSQRFKAPTRRGSRAGHSASRCCVSAVQVRLQWQEARARHAAIGPSSSSSSLDTGSGTKSSSSGGACEADVGAVVGGGPPRAGVSKSDHVAAATPAAAALRARRAAGARAAAWTGAAAAGAEGEVEEVGGRAVAAPLPATKEGGWAGRLESVEARRWETVSG